MARGFRPDRIADLIRVETADLLAREVRDPGLGFVTITRVKVTPDLQIARVFYTTLGEPAARKTTRRALERASPFLRRQLGGRLGLRRVPEIQFIFDESVEQRERIERLLEEIREQSAGNDPSGEKADDDEHGEAG